LTGDSLQFPCGDPLLKNPRLIFFCKRQSAGSQARKERLADGLARIFWRVKDSSKKHSVFFKKHTVFFKKHKYDFSKTQYDFSKTYV
jgi:hypothetical protein